MEDKIFFGPLTIIIMIIIYKLGSIAASYYLWDPVENLVFKNKFVLKLMATEYFTNFMLNKSKDRLFLAIF
jgi:hypothetical protein